MAEFLERIPVCSDSERGNVLEACESGEATCGVPAYRDDPATLKRTRPDHVRIG